MSDPTTIASLTAENNKLHEELAALTVENINLKDDLKRAQNRVQQVVQELEEAKKLNAELAGKIG